MIGEKDYKILIVDDSEINRAILSDIIDDKFTILEASNGLEAMEVIRQNAGSLSLVLLDLVMPEMDGLEVLTAMNSLGLISEIPVIMISSENSSSFIERAYELGATDFISRPFNVFVVKKRIANTIMLYSKQKHLINLVSEQIYEKEKNNDIMVKILSHIVEFRNGESGPHIMHVNVITELLLKQLVKRTDKYKLTSKDIDCIVTASSLHDIGKISIPDHILNKPGPLTEKEFEVIKTHPQVGADMLSELTEYLDNPLVITAYDICLCHHEKYDGKGYPNGLKGDEIPISAQIVSIADVYDALVSERCYKKAYPHQVAIDMICAGECGEFNPILLDCLKDISATLEREIKISTLADRSINKIRKITGELLVQNGISNASNSINHLEQARTKYEFFASMSQEIQYEYTEEPSVLTVNEWCSEKFGLPLEIADPLNNPKLLEILGGEEGIMIFDSEIKKTSPINPTIEFNIQIKIDNEIRFHHVLGKVRWSKDDVTGKPKVIGTIGKIIDVENDYQLLSDLKNQASRDALTSLYNHGYCEKAAKEQLSNDQSVKYAVALFDLDNFKSANDKYGHMFGDEVLKEVATTLLNYANKKDVVARIGGDEFMIFGEYQNYTDFEAKIQRMHNAVNNLKIKSYSVKASAGVALTEQVGYDYDDLFNCADTALYCSKDMGKNVYKFYDKEMKISGFTITPID